VARTSRKYGQTQIKRLGMTFSVENLDRILKKHEREVLKTPPPPPPPPHPPPTPPPPPPPNTPPPPPHPTQTTPTHNPPPPPTTPPPPPPPPHPKTKTTPQPLPPPTTPPPTRHPKTTHPPQPPRGAKDVRGGKLGKRGWKSGVPGRGDRGGSECGGSKRRSGTAAQCPLARKVAFSVRRKGGRNRELGRKT